MSDSIEVAVFSAARRLPPLERGPYLDEACAGDAVLRQRVERLLRANEEADEFLREPAPGAQRPAETTRSPNASHIAAPPGERVGERIGGYKLLEQVGQGGCGVVYMAEQEEPVRRKVALKVIKLGMDTEQVIARFEAERQVLAMMDHPNIAKVFDGGTTNAGRPYFVMELVRGIKITKFCEENDLSARQRLDLFIQVCQAIQHAHQKGIIHRDIKPSNILVSVSEPGAPGCPKVIDFGIAKATQGRLTDQTLFTAFEQFIGTPAYMSPEQAMMTNLDIDTRTDVYSLGVLLYELLTGRLPFDSKELLAGGLDEMRRTIREVEPPKPSTRLTQSKAESRKRKAETDSVSSRRAAVLKELASQVRGDLDWIVMKCLEKDRARRYATANGLASDLQRYLTDEPVAARPPSKLYRLQKLVRRNKLAFAVGGAVTAALLMGLGLLAKERRTRQRAVVAEQKAQTEAFKSEQIASLLKKAFQSVGPSVARGRDTVMVEEILDNTTRNIGNELTNQPQVEVAMCLFLADTYNDLGRLKQMEGVARHGLEVARTRIGEENESVANSLISVATALLRVGQERLGEMHFRNLEQAEIHVRLADATLQEAEKQCRQGLAMSTKLLGDENLKVARALSLLAGILLTQSRASEAEPVFRQALAMYQKLLGGQDLEVAKLMGDLAVDLSYQGDSRLAEAEAWIQKALAMQHKLFGENHPDIARSLFSLASVQHLQGKRAEAESMFRQTENMWRILQTDDRAELAVTLNNMAHVLRIQGKLPEAEIKQREALQVQRKVFGNKHKEVATSLTRLSIILHGRGQLFEAETNLWQALNMWRELQTKDRPEFVDTLHILGCVLRDEGRWAEAETNLTEALAMRRRLYGNEHQDVASSLFILGEVLDSQGKVEEALKVAREALVIHRKLHTNDSIEVADDLNNLGFYFSERDQLAEAETTLHEAVAMRKKVYGVMHLEVARSLNNLANVLRLEGKLSEAEATLREDLAVMQRLGEERIAMALLVDLASLLTREGKPADAESCLKQVMTREPHARVAVGLISVASSLKNERQRDCVERANCLLRCASEILQNMPSDDLAELPGWAISQLLDGGFKQQATNICWRMLESSCTNAAWFNEASWLLATAANPSNRDPSLAVELAKRSVKLNGDWNTLGVARYRAGDFKQAIADLEKCESLAAQPNVGSSFNYFFMAMAHHRRGDDTAARRCYEQAIKWMKEHSPQNPELIRFRAEAEALLGPTVQAHAQKQPEAP